MIRVTLVGNLARLVDAMLGTRHRLEAANLWAVCLLAMSEDPSLAPGVTLPALPIAIPPEPQRDVEILTQTFVKVEQIQIGVSPSLGCLNRES